MSTPRGTQAGFETVSGTALTSSAPGVAPASNATVVAGGGPAANAPSTGDSGSIAATLDPVLRILTSLRLTVICLGLGIILVFAGTIAQVDLGLLKAQNEFFRSFVIYWTPGGTSWRIPVFPGGYTIGTVLLANLVAAHIKRFSFSGKKAGIWIIHAGLILLLVGQLGTDFLARESNMEFVEGQTKNYSENAGTTELAVIDTSDKQTDLVYAIPQAMLQRRGKIQDARVPVTVELKKYWPNAGLANPDSKAPEGATITGANAGELKDVLLVPEEIETDTDHRNTPAALVEVQYEGHSVGKFILPSRYTISQEFEAGGKRYQIALRFARHYYPFSLTLLKATHEQYKGTDIPKNFASRVRVSNPERGETRETVIYMNNPLRYAGLTFYQQSMLAGELAERAGRPPSSTLQVVRNPGWLTPYVSCALIALGLLVQFGSHLFRFLRNRPV